MLDIIIKSITEEESEHEDITTIQDFMETFRDVEQRYRPSEEESHYTPVPKDIMDTKYTEDELKDVAESMRNTIFRGIRQKDEIWFMLGGVLFIMTRAGLFEYLGATSLSDWIENMPENAVKRSYPLLTKYRNVFRKWFWECGADGEVLENIFATGNVDILEAYTRVATKKNATAWSAKARQEKDKDKARVVANIALEIAKQPGRSIDDVTPDEAEAVYESKIKKLPKGSFPARKIKSRWRGDIPNDAYVRDKVEVISDEETRVTFRVVKPK